MNPIRRRRLLWVLAAVVAAAIAVTLVALALPPEGVEDVGDELELPGVRGAHPRHRLDERPELRLVVAPERRGGCRHHLVDRRAVDVRAGELAKG